MTKVERLYEIDDYINKILSDKHNIPSINKVAKLANEHRELNSSFLFEISIKDPYYKLDVSDWKRLSNIYVSFHERHNIGQDGSIGCLKSDNLIKLIEFITEHNLSKNICSILTNDKIFRLITRNYDYIKSHEYSDKLITLLSSDNIANIELVITMLELVEFEEPIRKPYKI